jgi:hypothetical protein
MNRKLCNGNCVAVTDLRPGRVTLENGTRSGGVQPLIVHAAIPMTTKSRGVLAITLVSNSSNGGIHPNRVFLGVWIVFDRQPQA